MMESLKNLPLINTGTQPISDATRNFYLNTFAKGSGPYGTYLLTDFLGTAIGVTVGTYFASAASIINNNTANLADLNEIYDVMIGVLDGSYPDPANPPDGIEIPVGVPGAGVYVDADAATVALIALAEAEIVTAQTAMGADGTTLNTDWNSICARVVYEAQNQSRASLLLYNQTAGDQTSVLSLIQSLGSIGNETQEGMAAQLFEAIADTAIASGQAIIGSMREGRNNTVMDTARIGHSNQVPDQSPTPLPQATLLNSEYTVAEARANASI